MRHVDPGVAEAEPGKVAASAMSPRASSSPSLTTTRKARASRVMARSDHRSAMGLAPQ